MPIMNARRIEIIERTVKESPMAHAPRCLGATITGNRCVRLAWDDGLCFSHLSRRRTSLARQRDIDQFEIDNPDPAGLLEVIALDYVPLPELPEPEPVTLVEVFPNSEGRWPGGAQRAQCRYVSKRKPHNRCTHWANIGTGRCSRHKDVDISVVIAA